jgi:hypothetical protein
MLDPILRLALAIHSSKGVYALLVGSGVSRSSTIPTGWEVVLDLIRKLAALRSESCDHNPETWYKALTGSDPDYSDILDQVTSSSAERGQLLRSYFEPTEEDREQGRKVPSPAHRAIAALVARGYVRVIVTTNFDRLLEQALVDEGVQPTVISTPDAVKGAMPLTHSPCTIIKIHGDYLDSRLRNTKPELSAYEEPFNDLLDRVFDEFGIVVCGWSAEWDVALRAALERCATHRFGTYWAAYQGQVSGEAEKLIGLRRATVVSIKDADTFFSEVAEKVRALEDLAVADPISTRVAVARMKRYLADPQQRINLHDLVSAEAERVYAEITSERFPDITSGFTAESILRQLQGYEAELDTLTHLLACGGYWADENQASVLLPSLKRIAGAGARGYRIQGMNLRGYPALVALYGLGLAAVAKDRYEFLARTLTMKVRDERDRPEREMALALSQHRILQGGFQNQFLPGRQSDNTRLSRRLFDTVRPSLRDYMPDAAAYENAFDLFEYLLYSRA